MNKIIKIIVSVLGGVNTIFSVFIPALIVLLILNTTYLNETNQVILIVVGLLSTLYRGVSNLILAFKN